MNAESIRYYRYRFPPLIVSHAVWLYHRFCLSFRDVEDLLTVQQGASRFRDVLAFFRLS